MNYQLMNVHLRLVKMELSASIFMLTIHALANLVINISIKIKKNELKSILFNFQHFFC